MTMSKVKPQRPGSRSGCNHHGDKHYSKHRDYSPSSDSSDEIYTIKHEVHCPLYSPSISDTSSTSFENEYYWVVRHERNPKNKNRPRHRSSSPKVHRRQHPKNASKMERKARSSTVKPATRPDTRRTQSKRRSGSKKTSSNSKPNQRRGNFSKRSSTSGTSTSSSSDSQQNFSNFKQSPWRGHNGRSPSSTSSESSYDSSCPNCQQNGKSRRSSYPRYLSGHGRGNGIVPPQDKSQTKHKPRRKHRYDSQKNSKYDRYFLPFHSAEKPRKSSRRRSTSSSSRSDFEQDYCHKHVRKSSKPKSHPQQHKKKKSKSRPRAK